MDLSSAKNQTLKVAILSDYLTAYGGSERVLDTIISLFPEAHIFTSQFWPELFPESYKNLSIKTSILQVLPHSKALRPLYRKLSFFVFWMFNLRKYDLILSSTSGPATWTRKNKSQKHISYFHKIPSFDVNIYHPERREGAANPIARAIDVVYAKLSRYFVRKIDTIITNSYYNAEDFNKIYQKQASVLYPPLNIKKIQEYTQKDSSKLLKKYNLASKEYYIFIGRLEKFKGIEYIISACIQEKKKLVVIGEGALSNKLPKDEYITYLGFVDDATKITLLKESRGLINGAIEQLGIVFIESLVCSTPIIAYRKGGVLELTQEDKNAVYFEEQNESAVRSALQKSERLKLWKKERYDSNLNLEQFTTDYFIKNFLALCSLS